jgi:hypothetical protein
LVLVQIEELLKRRVGEVSHTAREGPDYLPAGERGTPIENTCRLPFKRRRGRLTCPYYPRLGGIARCGFPHLKCLSPNVGLDRKIPG